MLAWYVLAIRLSTLEGPWTNRQALSVPSHLNIHDELDFSDPEVRETYSSRLDAAEFEWQGEPQFGWEWDFSTPTLPKYGISALYDISDQHQWWVRCQCVTVDSV